MKILPTLNLILCGVLLTIVVFPVNTASGATQRTLVSVDDAVRKELQPVTIDFVKEAEGCFMKAKFYESEGDTEKADLYFKKGVIALAKAEESNPGVSGELLKKLSEGPEQIRSCPGKVNIHTGIVMRNTSSAPDNSELSTSVQRSSKGPQSIDFSEMSRSMRSSSSIARSGSSRSGYSRSGHSSSRNSASSDKADKARRELDENYDRAKRGSGVLQWGLKLLNKIPVVKKFIPGGAEETAEAATKIGNKITAPKDGHAMINGELKVWNERKGRWEDF